MADALKHVNTLFPNLCYDTKFRPSGLNRLGVGTGSQKFGQVGVPPLKMERVDR